MTLPQIATLSLLTPNSQGHSTPDSSGGLSQSPGGSGARMPCVPDPMDMVQWRKEADARSETVLADFDAAIAGGEDPAVSAHRLLHGYIRWTRRSIQQFDEVTCTQLERNARQSERAVWSGIADLVSQTAGVEPAAVDRFLRIWLAVVHEATATGQAWLYAR